MYLFFYYMDIVWIRYVLTLEPVSFVLIFG